MDEVLKQGMSLAGEEGLYQYIVTFIIMMVGICTNICYAGLFLMETPPLISYNSTISNSTVITSINYKICQTSDYKILENESKHSWVWDYNIYCNRLQTSLLGFFYCFGCVIGSSILPYVIKKVGPKRSLLLATGVFSITCIAICFNSLDNLFNLYLCVTGLGFTAVPVFILKINVLSEISSSKLRPFLNNIALSSSNFTLMLVYFLFESGIHWKTMYLFTGIILLTLTATYYIVAVESPRYLFSKNTKDTKIEYIYSILTMYLYNKKKENGIETESNKLNEFLKTNINGLSEEEYSKLKSFVLKHGINCSLAKEAKSGIPWSDADDKDLNNKLASEDNITSKNKSIIMTELNNNKIDEEELNIMIETDTSSSTYSKNNDYSLEIKEKNNMSISTDDDNVILSANQHINKQQSKVYDISSISNSNTINHNSNNSLTNISSLKISTTTNPINNNNDNNNEKESLTANNTTNSIKKASSSSFNRYFAYYISDDSITKLNFILSFGIISYLNFLYNISMKDYSYYFHNKVHFISLLSMFSSFPLSYFMNRVGRRGTKIALVIVFIFSVYFNHLNIFDTSVVIVLFLINKLLIHFVNMVHHTHCNETFISKTRLDVSSWSFIVGKLCSMIAPFSLEYLHQYLTNIIISVSIVGLLLFLNQTETKGQELVESVNENDSCSPNKNVSMKNNSTCVVNNNIKKNVE